MSGLWRLLSHFWPIRVWSGQGRYGPLHLVWEGGHLVVNSDRANQSFGSLHGVWQRCFADERIADADPRNVLILGFGAGSAATILRRELGLQAHITGVDADPLMLGLARRRFHVDQLGNLELIEQEAEVFLAGTSGPYDLILIDLFHELDLSNHIEDQEFISNLYNILSPGGRLLFNTVVHDAESARRSGRTGDILRLYGHTVRERAYAGINRVFIAR